MNKLLSFAVATALALGGVASVQAAEITGAVGATSQSGMTYRIGAGWGWDKSWWESSTGRLTGYWDAGYTYWEGDNGRSSDQHSLSFAPVFVYEFGKGYVKPFVEAGIGVAVFSSTKVGEQDLGSAFNFEDRIGLGLKFGETQRVGIRATHYSNAGIKQPNDGIESYALFYSHSL